VFLDTQTSHVHQFPIAEVLQLYFTLGKRMTT